MYIFLAGLVFVVGYAGIALEHRVKLSKSAIALFMGAVLWLIVAVAGIPTIEEDIFRTGSDIFSIVVFLLAAMSLIEILVHYKFFDLLRGKLFQMHLDEQKQFLLIALITFFLSAFLDNLTTTIVMIQIARRFFKGENMLITTGAIVVAANAGGAFSPIGDVTTIMLWFAHKYTALEIIKIGFLPSITLWAVTIGFMYRRIRGETRDTANEIITKLNATEKFVIGLIIISFLLPVAMNLFKLPPYMGLVIGLGMVWLVIDLFKRFTTHPTHLEASIEEFIKKTDIPSLKFFIGILLAVGALHSLGLLHVLAGIVYGDHPAFGTMVAGNIGLGLLSAILDNVPLTAMAIQILQTDQTSLWVLLALSVGTGGSLLVIGSAAGVVAMGMVKELNFAKYFRIVFLPGILGYIAGITVWYLQYLVFHF